MTADVADPPFKSNGAPAPTIQTIHPPPSPLHPTHTNGFTYSEAGGGARMSADGRTVKSMDNGSPLSYITSSPKLSVIPGAPLRNSVDLDAYFSGPVDPAKHSKLPFWLRIHGSILPKLIIPLIFVAGWSSAVVCISEYVHTRESNLPPR